MTVEAALAMSWPEDAPKLEAAQSETAQLTAAIRSGDVEAFSAFYEAWFDRAYCLARSVTRRDESFCLDVVQDAMLRVVRSLPLVREPAALECWMARVVHTTALDLLRREARRTRREGQAAARWAAEKPVRTAGESIEVEERIAWLEARLGEVEPGERDLLRGRFESGKTFRALGTALGITGNAASGRVTRLITRLKALSREVFHD